MGMSFVHDAKIFRVPDYNEAFIMECGLDGKPMENNKVMVIIVGKGFIDKRPSSTIQMTHQFLFNMSPNQLKSFLNSNLLS
jgi:hypothetical protein